MILAVFSILTAAAILFIIFSYIIFYHIGKYSLIGDASKRVFFYFVAICAAIFTVGLILLIYFSIFL